MARRFREPAGIKLQTQRRLLCLCPTQNGEKEESPTTGTGLPEEAAREGAELGGVSLTTNSGIDSPHPTTTTSAPSSKTLSLMAGMFHFSSSCSPFRCALLPFSISSSMYFSDQRIPILLEGNSAVVHSKVLLKAGLMPKELKEHPQLHISVGATSTGCEHNPIKSFPENSYHFAAFLTNLWLAFFFFNPLPLTLHLLCQQGIMSPPPGMFSLCSLSSMCLCTANDTCILSPHSP